MTGNKVCLGQSDQIKYIFQRYNFYIGHFWSEHNMRLKLIYDSLCNKHIWKLRKHIKQIPKGEIIHYDDT